jgi:hypothetical protein
MNPKLNNFICKCTHAAEYHKKIDDELTATSQSPGGLGEWLDDWPVFIIGTEGEGICWYGWEYTTYKEVQTKGCQCEKFIPDNLSYLQKKYEEKQ